MAFSCTLYVIDLSNTTVILRVFVYSVFTGANAYTWTAFFFPASLDHLQISAKSFWVFSVEQRYEKQCDNVMQWRGAGERVRASFLQIQGQTDPNSSASKDHGKCQ